MSLTTNTNELLAADLRTLDTLTTEQIEVIVDKTLDFVVNPSRSSAFQESLSTIATSHKISGSVLKTVTRSLLIFLQQVVNAVESSSQLEAKCQAMGLQPNSTTLIISSWKKRSNQITSIALAKTVSSNRLIDMDWSFGVTAASDYSDQVGKTYLQLKLTIDAGEEGIKDEYFELTLEQFYQFLGQMEKCKSYLDLLSA